jgi:hypothetical protein
MESCSVVRDGISVVPEIMVWESCKILSKRSTPYFGAVVLRAFLCAPLPRATLGTRLPIAALPAVDFGAAFRTVVSHTILAAVFTDTTQGTTAGRVGAATTTTTAQLPAAVSCAILRAFHTHTLPATLQPETIGRTEHANTLLGTLAPSVRSAFSVQTP